MFIMLLYFTLSLDINCSRKQQKLEIKRGLHSLRLDCNLIWIKETKLMLSGNIKFKLFDL